MKKSIFITATIVLSAAIPSWAQDAQTQTQTQTQPTQTQSQSQTMTYDQNPEEMFRASELSLGVFGMGTVGERTLNHFTGGNVRRHGRLGLGADLEYFFTKYIGLEAEAWSENPNSDFVNNVGGNLVIRIPIGNIGLAPYVFGGGGHEFYSRVATYGDAGAGVEFRFCRHVGIFVDGRYVVPDHLGNYGLGRAGFRFAL
jgi:hypothetical protein